MLKIIIFFLTLFTFERHLKYQTNILGLIESLNNLQKSLVKRIHRKYVPIKMQIINFSCWMTRLSSIILSDEHNIVLQFCYRAWKDKGNFSKKCLEICFKLKPYCPKQYKPGIFGRFVIEKLFPNVAMTSSCWDGVVDLCYFL